MVKDNVIIGDIEFLKPHNDLLIDGTFDAEVKVTHNGTCKSYDIYSAHDYEYGGKKTIVELNGFTNVGFDTTDLINKYNKELKEALIQDDIHKEKIYSKYYDECLKYNKNSEFYSDIELFNGVEINIISKPTFIERLKEYKYESFKFPIQYKGVEQCITFELDSFRNHTYSPLTLDANVEYFKKQKFKTLRSLVYYFKPRCSFMLDCDRATKILKEQQTKINNDVLLYLTTHIDSGIYLKYGGFYLKIGKHTHKIKLQEGEYSIGTFKELNEEQVISIISILKTHD